MKCLICTKERKRTRKCKICGKTNCNGCNHKGVCIDCLVDEVLEDWIVAT